MTGLVIKSCTPRPIILLDRHATNLYTLSLRLWYFALQDMEDVRSAVTQHQAIYEALRDGKDNKAVN